MNKEFDLCLCEKKDIYLYGDFFCDFIWETTPRESFLECLRAKDQFFSMLAFKGYLIG
jgi:hypothetical protein